MVLVSVVHQHESAISIHTASLLNLPPTPTSHLALHPSPLGCHRTPSLTSLLHTANSHQLFYIWCCVCFYLGLSHPLLSHCVHKSVVYVSLTLPYKEVHQYHYSGFHM